MPIFIRGDVRVLYVHVPKTGGNAIMKFFQDNGFGVEFCDLSNVRNGLNALRTCSPQHYHAQLLSMTLRLHAFSYVFMTVRNPVDRLKSEFLWRVRDPASSPDNWARQTLGAYAENSFVLDNHIRPQHEFLVPNAEVFKMEDGYDGDWVDRVAQKTGTALSGSNVPRTHVAEVFSGRTTSDVVFSPEVTDQIRAFYAEDLSRFGYDDGKSQRQAVDARPVRELN